MDFQTLRRRLLETLRRRVRNGEWSERNLAARAAISQPHLHNILKGAREPSNEHADALLRTAGLTIADLMTEAEWDQRQPDATSR